MTTNNTRHVFDTTASTYDRDRWRLLPGYDRLFGWLLDLIPPQAQSIVDLGAGSGLLTALVRSRFPTAHIHLIDFSGPMLDLARRRLDADPNVTFEQADYLTSPLPAKQDAIVSSLSIHHLEDAGKRELFRKTYSALAPGGVFINAEHVGGPTPELEQRYQALWLQQIRALGATPQQIEESLFRQQEDRRASVDDQLRWMREAGFRDADCWYKENSFAVLAGSRQ